MIGPILIVASAAVSGVPAVPVERGVTRLRVDVNAEGRVDACELTTSSGSPHLDAQACALLKAKGRYQPMRDSLGNAIPSSTVVAINWRGAA